MTDPSTRAKTKATAAEPARAQDLTGVPFEAALAELEGLVAQMEGGGLSLEASLQAYQRGAQLVKHCQAQLQAVQEQVKIVEDDLQGDAPFSLGGGA